MPFMGQPDVLDIVFDVDAIDSLKMARTDTPFGSSEGTYLFMGDVRLGAPNNFSEYYRKIGVDPRGRTAVSLLPSFKGINHQDFPDLPTFWKSLKLIMDSRSDWTMICERDCEQYPFETLSYGTKSAQKAMTHLFRFLSGDGRSTCPTFIMKPQR
jgi:hypothetical protein